MPAATVEPTIGHNEPPRVLSTYHTSFLRHDATDEAFPGEPVAIFVVPTHADGHHPIAVPLFPSFYH